MKLILKSLYSEVISRLVPLLSKGKNNTVYFIISFHRSGSTWIQEYVSQALGGAPIFEPFYAKENIRITHHFNQNEAIYISTDKEKLFISNFITSVISKRYLSRWSISRTNIRQLKNSQVLIVKFIRANFIVSLLKEKFPNIRCIYLIRNPFSVVESVLQGGGVWKNAEKDFLLKYYHRYFIDYPLIKRFIQDEVENEPRLILLVRWCLETSACLKSLKSTDNIFFYERLKDDKSGEMNRLNNLLNIDSTNFAQKMKPSSSTSKVDNINKNYAYWQEEYDKDLEAKSSRILQYFDISFYNLANYYPILEKFPYRLEQ